MSKKKITICDDCPCLNRNYEDGASCNLDYNTELCWFRKSNNVIVADTPEMRSHQQDFDLKYVCMNCWLIKIETKEKIFLPTTLTGKRG